MESNEDILKDMSTSIEEFEKDLGLTPKFLDSLLHENDWAFIIKLSALLELVATNILVIKFKNENIEDLLAHLDYANKKSGKIAFLQKMDVITKEQFNVLCNFAELRNKMVHKIENTNFTFNAHISSFDKNQTKIFLGWVGLGISDYIPINEKQITKRDFILTYPKIAIWITIKEIIGCVYLDKKLETYKDALTFTIAPSLDTKTLKINELLHKEF